MAQWITRLPTEQKIAGSIPAWIVVLPFHNTLGIGVGVDTGGIGIGITLYKPLKCAFEIKQIIDYVILVFTLIRGLL